MYGKFKQFPRKVSVGISLVLQILKIQNIAGVIYLAQKQANIPHGNHAHLPLAALVCHQRDSLIPFWPNCCAALPTTERFWYQQKLHGSTKQEISQGIITLFVTGLPQP